MSEAKLIQMVKTNGCTIKETQEALPQVLDNPPTMHTPCDLVEKNEERDITPVYICSPVPLA